MKPRVFSKNDAKIVAKWFQLIFKFSLSGNLRIFHETCGLKPLARFESISPILSTILSICKKTRLSNFPTENLKFMARK